MTRFESPAHIPKLPESPMDQNVYSSTETADSFFNPDQISKMSLPQIDRLYSVGLIPLHMLPVLCSDYVEPKTWQDVVCQVNVCYGIQIGTTAAINPKIIDAEKTQQDLLTKQQNIQKKNQARLDKKTLQWDNKTYPVARHRKSRVYAIQQPRSNQKGFGPRIGKLNMSPTRTS